MNQPLNVGDVFCLPFSYTQAQVNQFAEITGDKNPLHLDAGYAAQTMFKRPIMHGFLGGSVFSKIFGTLFPGEGTIYVSQSMKFVRPMFVDTAYEAIMTVKTLDREKHRATIQTQIVAKDTGKVTIEGEATIINEKRI